MDEQGRQHENGLQELKGGFRAVEQAGRRRVLLEKKQKAAYFKEDLIQEQLRIAEVIKRLYKEISKNPDRIAYDLFQDYIESHPGGSFSSEVTQNFQDALYKYQAKRIIVVNILRERRKPETFFQECFGQLPKGKVEVIFGNMTICFRCFNEEDYIFAYTHSEQPVPKGLNEAIEKAKKSDGAALLSVKIPKLKGVVILEKASNNCQKRQIYTVEITKLEGRRKNVWQTFSYPNQKDSNLVILTIPRVGELKIHIMERDKTGVPLKVQVFSDDNRNIIAELNPQNVNDKPQIKIPLPAKGRYQEDEYVDLRLEASGFSIFSHTKDVATIKFPKWQREELTIINPKTSRRIRRHEEQHQFSRLFVPCEELSPIEKKDFDNLQAEQFSDPKKARRYTLQRLAMLYRQYYIDWRARDEIIAYYKDGRSLPEILSILSNSPLYDFKNEKTNLPSKKDIPTHVAIADLIWMGVKDVAKTDQIGFYKSRKWIQIPNRWLVRKDPFTKEEVNSIVSEVLNQKYQTALELWIAQIGNLERLGYNRESILSFLGMLPINRWRSFVNRLNRREKKS